MFTVVSLVPFPIYETKPGLHPGDFSIPAAKENDFSILHVGSSKYFVYMDSDRGSFEAIAPDAQIAQSIIDDYCSTQIAATMDERPGMFCVSGKHTHDEILVSYAKEIKDAKERQTRWFKKLVRIADDDWSKYHQHRMISDTQRYAARYLGMDREWLIQTSDIVTRCPGCNTVVDSAQVVCANCHAILNEKEYKNLKFATGA